MSDRRRERAVCKRGHPMAGDNLIIRYVRHRNGARYRRRECRACRNQLERVRTHRRGQYRKWNGDLPTDVLSRQEELDILIAQQGRDMRAGNRVPPSWLLGRRVFSLDWEVRDRGHTRTGPLHEWWLHEGLWND